MAARTLFEQMGGMGRYVLNAGAPGPPVLRRVAALMAKATEIRTVCCIPPRIRIGSSYAQFLYHRFCFFQSDELLGDAPLLQYGAPSGDPRFLAALSHFLSEQYDDRVTM